MKNQQDKALSEESGLMIIDVIDSFCSISDRNSKIDAEQTCLNVQRGSDSECLKFVSLCLCKAPVQDQKQAVFNEIIAEYVDEKIALFLWPTSRLLI